MREIPEIKILRLDTAATAPSGKGALLDMVLVLSDSLPYDAEALFDHAWRSNSSMYKRSASISGNQVTVTCLEDELQGQVDLLKQVLPQVVDVYNKRVVETNRRREEEKANAAAQKQRLSELSDKLKF